MPLYNLTFKANNQLEVADTEGEAKAKFASRIKKAPVEVLVKHITVDGRD